MKLHHLKELQAKELLPGFHGKFVQSAEMTTAYWQIEAGAQLPEHHHVHEQVSNILEGQFEFTVDGETELCGPGDVIVIQSNMPHSGKAITDCRILDVFSPARPEYS